MSVGVNKVFIIGNCTADPEVRYTPNGKAVCNMSVATNETWKDKETGEKQSKAEFHRVVIFGKLAEVAGQYLRKGSKVFLEGKLQTRKWQDQGGNERYSTEIVVDIKGQMQMLDSKPADGEGQQDYRGHTGSNQQNPTTQGGSGDVGPDDPDDSIPFAPKHWLL